MCSTLLNFKCNVCPKFKIFRKPHCREVSPADFLNHHVTPIDNLTNVHRVVPTYFIVRYTLIFRIMFSINCLKELLYFVALASSFCISCLCFLFFQLCIKQVFTSLFAIKLLLLLLLNRTRNSRVWFCLHNRSYNITHYKYFFRQRSLSVIVSVALSSVWRLRYYTILTAEQ